MKTPFVVRKAIGFVICVSGLLVMLHRYVPFF